MSTEEGRKRPLIHEQMLRFRERHGNPTATEETPRPRRKPHGGWPALCLGDHTHAVAGTGGCEPRRGPQMRPRSWDLSTDAAARLGRRLSLGRSVAGSVLTSRKRRRRPVFGEFTAWQGVLCVEEEEGEEGEAGTR